MVPNAVRVLQAFVLDEPGSWFLDAIQNSSERPWFRVHRRIFDPCFVLDRIGAGHPIAFNDADLSTVKVSCLVEPKLIGQRNDVGYERVALPSITRIAHPPVRAVKVRPGVRVKDTERMIVLVDNRKVSRALKNLQWRWKIRHAGNTGLI